METLTARTGAGKHATGTPHIVTYLGAAAFVIAATWFGLATKGVTVATAPRLGPNAAPQQGMHFYYRWQVTTLPQERYYTSIAIAGFLCLAAAAIFLRDLLAPGSACSRSAPASCCGLPGVSWNSAVTAPSA